MININNYKAEKYYRYWFSTILMILMSASFSACSDKDKEEPNSISQPSIVGTWRSDFSSGYQLQTFSANGKVTFFERDYDAENYSGNGTYKVKNNVLTIDWEYDETDVFTIISLTSKTLILRYEGSYVGEYDDYYDEDYEEWYRVE